MSFSRPVDDAYPIWRRFGEWAPTFDHHMDPDTGFWLPIQNALGLGQHRGTDFDCPQGSIVRAMCDGMIVDARTAQPTASSHASGLYILQLALNPGFDSWKIRYSHLKAIYVTRGQRVRRYDAIAESGNSGRAVRPMLHVDLQNLRHQFREIPFES